MSRSTFFRGWASHSTWRSHNWSHPRPSLTWASHGQALTTPSSQAAKLGRRSPRRPWKPCSCALSPWSAIKSSWAPSTLWHHTSSTGPYTSGRSFSPPPTTKTRNLTHHRSCFGNTSDGGPWKRTWRPLFPCPSRLQTWQSGQIPRKQGGGGIFSGVHGQRRLVPRGEPPPHQHPGMSGCHTLSPQTGSSKGLGYPGEDRQHGCGIPHQQAGIKQEQGPVTLPARSPSTVRAEQMDHPIKASTRPPQHMGGLPLSQSPRASGVVPVSTELSTADNTPQSRDRPLCSPWKRQAADLRMPIPVPLSYSGRHPSYELEQVEEDLSLPPSRPDSNMPPKTRKLRRLRAGHCSSTSFRSLVARVPSRLHPARCRPGHRAMGARRVAESSRENVLSLSRFQYLKNLYTLSYEAPVALALSTAHRRSTMDQYEHCWKDFQQWLTSNPTKPISKDSVLLYLNYLVQARRLSPKTVLVYRNALKLPLLHGFNIDTSDREFSLLARSQFLQNPPPKKLIPAWNPNKVLSMLEQPEFLNHRATPHRLLMKTLFLIALATGNRVSKIAAFTRVGSKILPGSKKAIIPVRPGFLYKNQTMDRSPPNIVIKALLNQDLTPNRLCPADSLHCWLALSDPWGIDAIFANPKSHKKMNRGAVSQLLVTTINQSQPGVLAKAHDIRKVSATFAWARGVPPHQIIQTMFWRSTSVFIDKYLVPLQTGPWNNFKNCKSFKFVFILASKPVNTYIL